LWCIDRLWVPARLRSWASIASQDTLTPAFKLVISIVTSLTILSLGVSISLALYRQKSDQINALIETCSTTYKLGFGALVGLIGGKAL
jgi:hypothetical protein